MTDDAKTSSVPGSNVQGVTQAGDLIKAMAFIPPKVTVQHEEQAQVQQDTEIKAMTFIPPKVTVQNTQQTQVQPETTKKE